MSVGPLFLYLPCTTDGMMSDDIKKPIIRLDLDTNQRGFLRGIGQVMCIRMVAGMAFTLAVLSLPLTGAAQKFQEPTKEELQMTSDPKAPGAPAVYLYREEETNIRKISVSCYARIKVLTEKGKEWATVQVPYFSGYMGKPIIEGRTIHSDGTIVPLIGKPEEILIFKNKINYVKAVAFNLPSVEVGSILEYRWSIPILDRNATQTQDEAIIYNNGEAVTRVPEWEVQQDIYVHKEHFFLSGGGIADLLSFVPHLPQGVQVIKNLIGDFSLDVQDVPALKSEEYAPPESSLRYRVQFFLTPYVGVGLFWQDETKDWSKRLDRAADQSTVIKEAANRITVGVSTSEAKARKLYDAVQALDNTNFSRIKTKYERKQLHLKKELKNAQDVWNEKSGSGNDIATLYLALARAAGFNVDGLLVADRSERIVDPYLLTLDQFDSLLVVLHIDGKDINLDPGEKLCPFGQLHWTHIMSGGIQENIKGFIITPPNNIKEATTAHAADLNLDAQGGITGTVKMLMNGPEALHWRQLSLTSDPEEVKKQLNESLHNLLPQGITGEVDKI